MRPADALVVGGGIGGLCAAIELGASGSSVVLLEAHDRVGGKAGRVTIEGVEADTGPSLLTMPEVFDAALARAGTKLTEEVELLRPEPFFRYHWRDGASLDVSHGLERTLESVRLAFGARARGELEAYLRHAASIWEAAAPAFVHGDAPSLRSFAAMGLRALPLLGRIEPLRTLSASIRRHVREPHLVMLLERYATYNGSDPSRAPATLGCIAHVDLTLGGYGLRGGVAALVRALERAALRVGVEIRTGAEVARAILERGRIAGVELASGESVRARALVANAEPARVLGSWLPPGTVRRRALEPSMSGWTAIIKRARAEGAALAPHTVLFPRDYAAEFRDIFVGRRPPSEPTVYVCAQSRAHAREGWPEHEALFVMVNAPAEPEHGESARGTWPALRARVLERLERAEVIAPSDTLLWERTPSDLARAFPGSRGAIYGASSNSMQSAFLRPGNVVGEVPGLFLASGGAHPGGGMPLAALSGLHAARNAARHLDCAARG